MRLRGKFWVWFLSALCLWLPTAEGAKKYYPPGFTPPPDAVLLPSSKPIMPPPVAVQPRGGEPPAKPTVQDFISEKRYYEALQAIETQLQHLPASDLPVAKRFFHQLDAKGDGQQSILLLETLVNTSTDRAPEVHRAYQAELVVRLMRTRQWAKAYRVFTADPKQPAALQDDAPEDAAWMEDYAEVVYHHTQGLLDRREVLQQPLTLRAMAHFRREAAQHREAVAPRLHLLMLDPLTLVDLPVPMTRKASPQEWLHRVQLAFLQGDWASHQHLLKSRQAMPGEILEKQAATLRAFGDPIALRALPEKAKKPTPSGESAPPSEALVRQRIRSLQGLSLAVTDPEWRQAVESTLAFVGVGNASLYAAIAEGLEKRNQTELALFYQRLAAQYAPSGREKQRWLQRANKTLAALSGESPRGL